MITIIYEFIYDSMRKYSNQKKNFTWLCNKLRTAEPEKLLTEALSITIESACIDPIMGCKNITVIRQDAKAIAIHSSQNTNLAVEPQSLKRKFSKMKLVLKLCYHGLIILEKIDQ